MFARVLSRRKLVGGLAALGTLALTAACAPVAGPGAGAGESPALQAGAPVPVALLVPAGSANQSDAFVAQNLENAARLAIGDLNGVQVDLRVYATGGNPQQAAAVAQTAVAEGAAIILGPVYAEEANAVGVAVAPSGVNVLAFSNNPTIAGGNVFLLGPTFRNTADRLIRYGRGEGVERYLIAYANDLGGAVGRDAIQAAAADEGATIVGAETYELSQQGIQQAAPRIAAAAQASGAQAVFTTAGPNADLPVLATALPEAGLATETTRLLGLTRWDAAPQLLTLPGLQGGLFAVPDRALTSQFEARYQAAYNEAPHPLAALAYDGVAAIGALARSGNPQALSRASLTQGQGFQGTAGIFRLLPDGTNQRGLAVATIRNNQVVILDPAPRSFAGAGF
ncbi:ABC-type branched-chain amino acid transport system, periplasmic component [Rubellimicrobium mesophilum DSM 19309]|uniref:ABC-type branched-chain amino acid transport system, periplasmic component n=1 Tax=Rubellimicrobium mesophilum DSM 19309 TaxID=442562 RepID=A0A017HI51_9RHOB|nr:penicillin-binding protein activator [Rubellimicrobium mesophilum]EYD73995.1 ABC-type branched-chain amino acid transport system, periplasmic component [Rubellimicrobium mesophilum DSM 19309]